jgi:3-dehydroquinate dehydratase/shikimate dehydrogenase
VDKHSIFQDRKALILGAGGAARAIVYGLKRRGASVVIASRTKARSDRLAADLGCDSTHWDNRHSVRAELLINCTPVGMHPNVDVSPYSKAYLHGDMLVFDTVYNPERTLLVAEAWEKHCTVITGVEMFVRQAAIQYKLFTGLETSRDQLRETLKRATGAVRY